MATQINTILVLRNDSTTAWESEDSYILLKGELGVGYLENGNVIVKSGDGETHWKKLPQVEGVFENDLTLTYDFGRHKTSNGYVEVAAKGMTTSEWLLDALSEVQEPSIAQPSITTTASIVGGGEMGAYVTGVKWTGTYTDGSYQYGSEENANSTATGLDANDVTWAISNSVDTQTATTEDGTFTFTSANYPQINTETSKTYATVTAKYTLDATDARTPLNNVGKPTSGKIESITEQKTNTAEAKATGYRKPFWAVLTTPYAETKNDEGAVTAIALTSADVRAFSGNGTATKGLPSTLAVAEGSRQVIFAAKAGVYKSLVAKDGNAQDATVTFSKIANAVNVEGANSYTATAYDIFEVTWGDPIASAKALKLTWSYN